MLKIKFQCSLENDQNSAKSEKSIKNIRDRWAGVRRNLTGGKHTSGKV